MIFIKKLISETLNPLDTFFQLTDKYETDMLTN